MDKSCHSSSDSTTSSSSSAITTTAPTNISDGYLKHLNKLSHKISKPTAKRSSFDHSLDHPPPPPPQQPQPPVYNISKSEFREVVQKLTGSPAHDRLSSPPPIQHPKPPSSRLQRIRPPPLAHLGSRPPPPLLNGVVPEKLPAVNPDTRIAAAAVGANPGADGGFNPMARLVSPPSPLPPFPSVNLPAESPVSAYMRSLQRSALAAGSQPDQFSGFLPLSPLVSPWWSSLAPPPSQPQPQPQPPPQQIVSAQQGILPPPSMSPQQPLFQLPSSPLPFGCLNSPRSPHPLLSPGLLFSPMSGQLGCPQFPLSPAPVQSPKHRGL
ncbi:VQ motif-containing protein 9 [Eucalyptus grandis]|uniref:VQ motif-containing protein 9 n=1 Tax=Eucalyptus grandis TaxID=71139 RepID=UPI00192EFA2D|nr:VQ motif-containing protein 9 [Eucalyptus grandis]XP_010025895.2 VQ motif-containing protein 9 [Eucalyptus grandis]